MRQVTVKLRSGWLAALLVSVVLAQPLSADSALDAFLRELQTSEAIHFSYHETRHMALLQQSWKTQGEMYIAPQQMIVDQRQPSHTLTLITTQRLDHLDLDADRRFSREFDAQDAPGGISALIALFSPTGNREALQQRFAMTFEQDAEHRRLLLQPRVAQRDVRQISIAVAADRQTSHMTIDYWDGDSSEWNLTTTARGDPVVRSMDELMSQIRRHADN